VPDSVRALAGARVAELTATARDVLLAASVLGTRFRRDVLAALAGTLFDIGHGELAARSRPGVMPACSSWPVPARTGSGTTCRDAIYDAIPVAAREDLHDRAGDVLAALAGRGRDVDDAEVAYHLARAGTAAAGPAAEYARRAGDRALAALAFEDAVHWYERAAASLTALRAGDDEQACAALRLGAARLAAGDLDGGRAGFRIRGRAARRRADQPAGRGQVRPAGRARRADRAGHGAVVDRLDLASARGPAARAGRRGGAPGPFGR
jgi:predicted ATPase